jgi:hypothetical protein
MSSLEEMARVAKAYGKAIRKTDSVVFVNDQCIAAAMHWLQNEYKKLVLLGIKNTNQIPNSLILKLKEIPRIVWMTVDKMADHGRAIDTSLINPLSGQVMTGSSSGSAVNILNGIIDAAIATDGGGSILAPALSTGLVGINGKGLGLHGKDVKVSTDGFEFCAGIGTVARNFDIAFFLMECLVGSTLSLAENPYIHAAISTNALDRLPTTLKNQFAKVVPFDINQGLNRDDGIKLLEGFFNENINLVITYEGPIDREGYGDSILGGEGQKQSGKYLLKSGNIVNATSVAIPSTESGCGFVVQSPRGVDNGKIALYIAQQLAKEFKPSKIYQEYFRKMAYDTQKGFLEQ